MKNLKAYRKFAILLKKTDYNISVSDVFTFLEAQINFFHENQICNIDEEDLIKTTRLPKETVQTLIKALQDAFDINFKQREKISLAQDYMMTDTALYFMMRSKRFMKNHYDFFNETFYYRYTLRNKILHECETKHAEEYKDFIIEGEIPDETAMDAIFYYLKNNH